MEEQKGMCVPLVTGLENLKSLHSNELDQTLNPEEVAKARNY